MFSLLLASNVCVFTQVWAVNSAGRSASPWANERTGPAPPEGVGPPIFLRVSATSAVVNIRPPARPNGIVSLYRVFSVNHNNHTLVSISLHTCLKSVSLLDSYKPLFCVTHTYSLFPLSFHPKCALIWSDLPKCKHISPSHSFQRGHPISRHSMVYVPTPSTG